jgi:uncharacterized protein
VSRPNLEVAREGFEAMRDGDVEALLPFVHPEFELTTPPNLAAEPDTYRGKEGVRRYFSSFYEAMDRVWFEADDFVEVGGRVIVPTVLRTRGRTTGIETEQRLVQVWELKDELAFRIEVYPTIEEAMEAARSAQADA